MRRRIQFACICLVLLVGVHQTATGQEDKKPIADVIYEVIQKSDVSTAIAQYRELKKTSVDAYDFSEPQLNSLGYKLLGEGRQEAAIAILKLNAELFPESVNVHDSLGECYLAIGKNDLARSSYERVLSLLADSEMPAGRKQFFENNAKAKIYQAEHFVSRSEANLNYIVSYGGGPAGKWDMENAAAFSEKNGVKLCYTEHNLYRAPVPQHVERDFAPERKGDVGSSFVAGDYRQYIEQGLIRDISDIWQAENWDETFPESFKRMCSYDGRQYFVPQAFQANPIWYRKDIFEKHGWQPPTTWEELLHLCDSIHAAGYWPMTVSAQGWPPPVARWFTILNLRLNGSEFHEEVMRGKVPYTDARIRDVFAHWGELFQHDAFADSSGWNTYGAAIQDIVTGRAVMYNLGEWIFESLPDSIGVLLDFFPVPELNPDVESAEIVHTYGAFIFANSRKPEQSQAFLNYLASEESQTDNARTLQRINANLNVDPSVYTDVQHRLFDLVKETEVLVPLFEFNTPSDLAAAGLKAFVDFWRNPEDVDAILERWEAERVKVMSSD